MVLTVVLCSFPYMIQKPVWKGMDTMVVVYISEAFLYLCFSLLLGGLLSYVIPRTYQPGIEFPQKHMVLCILGIALFSFMPVIRIVMVFAPDIGFWLTFKSVMTTFEEGKAYVLTLVLSVLILLVILNNDIRTHVHLAVTSLFIVLGMIVALGFSSHVYSLAAGVVGGVVHSVHFLAVSVWTGLLFMGGWYAKDRTRWLPFLKWFTPLSVACMATIGVSGLIIMQYTVPQYINSWILTYGQALLLKHILIIPLVTFAFINGFVVRRRITQSPGYNGLAWIQAESAIVFCIFAVTGFMGQQSPPHDVSLTLLENKPSVLFNALYQGGSPFQLPLSIAVNMPSLLLGVLALALLCMVVFTFINKQKMSAALVYSGSFILAAYLSLMLAVK
ncbi:copper resistance D family protein [Paenibacillus agricola]|nr:CopD family protein [Paenibacillus agricola]